MCYNSDMKIKLFEKRELSDYFVFNWQSSIAFILIMGAASAVCLFLQKMTTSDVHVPMIFVLAVLLIALTTDGYVYGILGAVASVFAVNWAFTYPYMKLDFSIYGYPLTFLTMLAVGMIVSTLVSRLRLQEKIKIESEKERMRANLLRSISHDLRTPLTSISGTIGMVLEEGDSLDKQQTSELLTDAKDNADWLYRMVENLLSITRMSGAGEIKKSNEVPEEVIGEVISKFSKNHPEIRISVSLPDEFFFVPMDAMLIEQLMLNLMDNAVIHGRTTSKINISVEKQEGFVKISVSDNGQGLDTELSRHLFDGSLQLSGRNAPDQNKFMGIGLMVCKTIAEAHGGRISFENNPGGGARFSFTLSLEDQKNDYQRQDFSG